MPPNFYREMGKRIYEIRMRLRLTQEGLASKAGISHQLCSTAERGTKATRADNIVKIAMALDVSADYLMTGRTINTDLHILSDKLDNMSESDLKRVMEIIEIFARS